jgi:hypothetical protein
MCRAEYIDPKTIKSSIIPQSSRRQKVVELTLFQAPEKHLKHYETGP